MTITEFLLALIAEDEACAGDGDRLQGPVYIEGYGDQALIGEKRLLAECEAKRRIVEDAINQHTSCDELDWVVQVLASVYADHPEFREEWHERG